MEQEIILCIPGPWEDRAEFLRAVITREPAGDFMFAGVILAHIRGKDHVTLDFCGPHAEMREAFQIAGQGRLGADALDAIHAHKGVAYLHFPTDWLKQRDRMIKFTDVVRRAGGIAVKVESTGVAHEWDRWFALLAGSPFDAYCAAVTLVGDTRIYYSCGMHLFGLPECGVPRALESGEAAELMNRFNMYQIMERPELGTGNTFSVTAKSPRWRLELVRDSRHGEDELFHNPHGVWELERIG